MLRPACAWGLAFILGLFLWSVHGCSRKPVAVPAARHDGYMLVSPREAAPLAARLSPASQGLSSWLDLQEPLLHSLSYLRARPQSEPAISRGDLPLTWGRLTRSAERLLELLPRLDREPELLAREFEWFRLGPEPLLTGYYAPIIEASLSPCDVYRYPIYAVPEDLQRINLGEHNPGLRGQVFHYRIEDAAVRPYYSRREIELEGVLAGRSLELAWARDPLELFYLHVQGSGFLQLSDGSLKHVQYGGKNGLPFKSISQVLLERGHLQRHQLGRARIAAFLEANPDMKHELLAENPSFIFFRRGDGSVQGAMQRPLTAMVSLASDPRLVPLGSLVAFSADLPPTQAGGTSRRILGLGMAHDTGSAIKGNRFDLYCGIGRGPEYVASRIKTGVDTYLLLSRESRPGQGFAPKP